MYSIFLPGGLYFLTRVTAIDTEYVMNLRLRNLLAMLTPMSSNYRFTIFDIKIFITFVILIFNNNYFNFDYRFRY
jgi:hypothetical protein